MDMKISGSGVIPSGEYKGISISGSGRIDGFVRCDTLSVSGACHGGSVDCHDMMKVSGSCRFDGEIRTASLAVSGSLNCTDLYATKDVRVSGGVKCTGKMRCGELIVSGGARAEQDIEAESVTIKGRLECEGLLNAENIEIEFSAGMKIGSIGGSNIVIRRRNEMSFDLLPLFRSIVTNSGKCITVDGGIEGDTIAIEGVVAKRVSGNTVAIGEGCDIELVQYTENVEISPKSKVGTVEKV